MMPWESCVLWLDYPIQNGVWPDVSKQDNDGACIGVRWEEDSIAFDGINDYVDVVWHSSLDITTNLTIEMLIKPELGSNATLVAGRGLSANEQYHFQLIGDGRLCFGRYPPSGGTACSTILVSEEWTHVAMVLRDDDDTVDFYINGVGEQKAYTENYTGTTPTKFTVGAYSKPGMYWFYKGRIAMVRVYNKALTAAQVREAYEQCYRLV